MKKKFYKYGLFYIGVVLAACADNADLNEPTGSTTPPSQVLNATVKNLPGAAIIYYGLPDDQNLKYVRASYKVDNMIRTVNASFYTDSLVVEGFPTKGEYDVELYSVSYGEAVSTPLVVKVSPDTPPYQKVRGTLISAETFGGIKVNFDNPEKAKLGLGVIKKQVVISMYAAWMLLLQILVFLSEIDGDIFLIHCMSLRLLCMKNNAISLCSGRWLCRLTLMSATHGMK